MKLLFAIFIGCFALAMKIEPLKNTELPLQNIHWKLIELSGKFIPANATAKEMFMVLKNDSTAAGNGGCNAFSGHYSLGKNNEISFGEMVRTNILCGGIDFERKYLDVLSKTDHYKISGDTLSLQNQFIDLAKFVGKK